MLDDPDLATDTLSEWRSESSRLLSLPTSCAVYVGRLLRNHGGGVHIFARGLACIVYMGYSVSAAVSSCMLKMELGDCRCCVFSSGIFAGARKLSMHLSGPACVLKEAVVVHVGVFHRKLPRAKTHHITR